MKFGRLLPAGMRWPSRRSARGSCAADSVGANIAEGSGRGSNNDDVRFLRMSRGSLYETRHWLRRAFKRDLLSPEQIKALSPLLDKLTPMLNAYIRSIGTYQAKDDAAKIN